MEKAPKKRTLTICQAAAKLALSESQVWRLAKRGVLQICDGIVPKSVYESGVVELNRQMKAVSPRKERQGLTIPQTAIKLGVSSDWIRSSIKKGTIKMQQLGRVYYIPQSEIERLTV